MDRPCPPIAALEDWVAAGPADPRRLHVDSCPRCRARRAALRTFLDPGGLPEGADLGDATRRLDATIRSVIVARRDEGRPFAGAWRSLFWPIWKPVIAIGLVASLVVLVLRPAGEDDSEIMLRGAREEIAPRLDAAIEAGTLRLSFSPVARAARYRITLHDASLTVIRSIDAGSDTTLRLPLSEAAPGIQSGEVLVVRLEVLDAEGTSRFSAPVPVRFP